MKTKAARCFVGFSWLAVLVTFSAVSLLMGFLLYRSWHTLNLRLFFGDTALWQALTGAGPVWERDLASLCGHLFPGLPLLPAGAAHRHR